MSFKFTDLSIQNYFKVCALNDVIVDIARFFRNVYRFDCFKLLKPIFASCLLHNFENVKKLLES